MSYCIHDAAGIPLSRYYTDEQDVVKAFTLRKELNSSVVWYDARGVSKVWLWHWTQSGPVRIAGSPTQAPEPHAFVDGERCAFCGRSKDDPVHTS